ncbi:MAG: hypothetical protein ABIR46_02285 [Candidatus Saccharimonadales bacterium]
MRNLTLFFASLALAGTTITLTATGATAADVNFGCIPQLVTANGLSPSTQAPGITGNGPLVILKDGRIITANAFSGSSGC